MDVSDESPQLVRLGRLKLGVTVDLGQGVPPFIQVLGNENHMTKLLSFVKISEYLANCSLRTTC